MAQQEVVQKQWMNVQEVAAYLTLKPSTIYTYVCERKIPHYKRGHIVRFKVEEIDAWLESCRVQTIEESLEQMRRGAIDGKSEQKRGSG